MQVRNTSLFMLIKCIVMSSIIALSFLSYGQQGVNFGQFSRSDVIGGSDVNSINVNHQSGTTFQDLKRAIIFIYNPGNGQIGSGFLVNTVNNTFGPDQGRKVYIATAHHVVNDIAVNDSSGFWVSFDYEMAHASLRGDNKKDVAITKVYGTFVIGRVVDEGADIALLEINFGDLSLDTHKVFENAYAAGWTLHPSEHFANISHPKKDHKKVYVGGQSVTVEDHRSMDQDINNRKFWYTGDNWLNGARGPEVGSSGSPLIDEASKLTTGVAVEDLGVRKIFSALENSWYSENDADLMSYLDPDKTWMSQVPGGYIQDLNMDTDTKFDLTINSGETFEKENYSLNTTEIFGFDAIGHRREQLLSDGITKPSTSADVYFTVTTSLTAGGMVFSDDILLYGKSRNSTINATTPFRGEGWIINEDNQGLRGSGNLENFGQPFGTNSQDLKANLIKYFNARSLLGIPFEKGIKKGLINEELTCKLKLFRQDDGMPSSIVRAVKLPRHMPYNTRELFDPNFNIDQVLTSNSYPPSRGRSSSELYIDAFSIGQYNHELRSINSGDNGGYLNLINPNYTIGRLVTTDLGENDDQSIKKIEIIIDPVGALSGNFFYKVWIDYNEDHRYGGNDQINEEILSGQAPNSVTAGYILPNYSDLGLTSGGSVTRRLRITVSSQPINSSADQHEQGEVEDFLIEIAPHTASEALAASALLHIAVGEGIQPGEENQQCLAPAPDEVNVRDETVPRSCNAYVCSASDCKQNAADENTKAVGSHAIYMNGTSDRIDLDIENEFIHDAFSNRTVSFWMNTPNNTGVQDLYDEGSSANGFALRQNGTKAELTVTIAGQSSFISSVSDLPANQWVNVTGVFKKGEISLYLNGAPESSGDFFKTNNITSVPDHPGEAAFGGTNGTNGFNETNNHYDGWLDEMLVYDRALTLDEISILATPVSVPSARFATTTEEMSDNEAPWAEAEATEFKVFPTPAKDHLNVLVAVRQAGSLQLEIVDLQGRRVYEMDRDHLSAGYHLITLSHLDLPTGPYVLLIQAGDVVRREKILIE